MNKRRKSRGFTLVELMVSLLAGLIVTTAVVGLARAATATFFEAARMASTESSVRNAAERLRQDLSRAAYMSTGNIRVARDGVTGVPKTHKIAVNDPTGALTGSRYAGLNDLQGIHIVVGGSGSYSIGADAQTSGPNNLSANNGLNPDAITLGGNFTTDDSYQGTFSTAGGCGGGVVRLTTAADPAVGRLISNGATPTASVNSAFTPVAGFSFAARIVDSRGCQHFTVVCSLAATATSVTINLQPDASGGPGAIKGAKTTCGASEGEQVTINPVQRVRWYIGANTDAPLAPAGGFGLEPAGNKFNLYRELLDASDTPLPILATRQIVSEYAVDLKFGISVAKPSDNSLQIFEMDSDLGGGTGNIDTYTQNASIVTAAGAPGAHRVRSVRFRVVTRAGIADRPGVFQPSPGPLPYLTRYCVQGVPAAACTNFARLRTVVSEVALLNQLGMTY